VKYEDWLGRKLADGDTEMIQSILVGYDFSPKVLDYIRNRRRIERKTVRLVKYQVNASRNGLVLDEVPTSH